MSPAGEPAPEAVAAPGFRAGRLANFDAELFLRRLLVLLVLAWLTLAVAAPLAGLLAKSLADADGNWVGLANFARYFATPALSSSLGHSLAVALASTAAAVGLGLAFALALTRTRMPAKGFFKGLALMLLFSPTLLNGIALIYLFGKKGLITKGFFGLVPGLDLDLYGFNGIVLAEVIYTFPQALLILMVGLRATDARLYEAASALGARPLRVFFSVTLPGIRYALSSAALVCFILAFTDFGAPKVVGGQYNILATDIYKQVIGQQNFAMGAVVSVVLLLPTLAAFVADRLSQRRLGALISSRSTPYVPAPHPLRDGLALGFCSLVGLGVLAFFATALFASLVKVWPYDLSLGLGHYRFESVGGGGLAAFGNSLRMSAYSAALGAGACFVTAYLVEKGSGLRALRQGAHFLSMVPLALPGMVIGLAYIFFFNAPGWELGGWRVANPFHGLYATMGILVLSNVAHFSTVAYLTATTALKQLDKEFEAVSASLGAPFWRTFGRVTAPVCLPAILEIAVYFFVNSMATVSAVIFLYSADLPLAAVAVANMDDAGDTAPACAMSLLIVLASLLARGAFGLATRGLSRRSAAWSVR